MLFETLLMSPVDIVPIRHSSAHTPDLAVKLITESSTGRTVEIDAVRGAALVDLVRRARRADPVHVKAVRDE
jgi:hypothetical protein